MKISKELRREYITQLKNITENNQILSVSVEFKKHRYFIEEEEGLHEITKLISLALDLPFRERKNGRSPISYGKYTDVKYTLNQSFLNVGIEPPTIKGVL